VSGKTSARGSGSRPAPGLVLADSRAEAEALAYLQRRLILFYGVTLALAGVLFVAGLLMTLLAGQGALLDPSRFVHLGALLAAAGILAVLRRCALRARTLILLDGLGLYVSIGACVAIYALLYREAPLAMPTILILFLVARAVAVPCSPKTTLALSVPAPLLLLAIQLAHGTVYAQPGVPMEPAVFRLYAIWNTIVAGLGVGIATLASHVGLGLRLRLKEATRLGQYQLEERIGQGSMGEVFRARHAMLRRPTAIKVIHPDATDPELLKRFEQEVRQTSRLSHPNTVAIFDYGRTPEGAFYYAMEYLDGPDLRQLVEQGGPFPAARAIHVLCQACGALAEAHDAGLVHRDIKPGNLVLCSRGGEHDILKVVDFGLVKDLSRDAGSLTQVGQICGTPETIAPEVLGGAGVTPAADLYALGIVGYYLVTAQGPFDARSAAELIGHHLHTAPVPPRARRADVPEDLEAVLLRCLAKDPGGRPGSARALRADLRACGDAGRWGEEEAAAWWQARTGG